MPHQRLKLHNDSDTPVQICVEPWGEVKQIQPANLVEVVFNSERPGSIEMSYATDEIRVYGWEGCVFYILENNLWDGPSILQIIRSRVSKLDPDEADRIVSEIQDVDELEFVQVQMDNAPYWDVAGRETAIAMAERIENGLAEIGAEQIGKLVASDIRSSRGVFGENTTEEEERTKTRR